MVFVCRGILFDVDGVLVDSTRAVARVWRRWAEERGLDPAIVIHEAHGRRSIETVRALAPHLDAELENEHVESLEIADREGIVALPGAAELLRRLPADRFSLVTSATRALAVARLEHAGLRVPERLISADDVADGKPSPRPYLNGAALLGLRSRDCLVFEDTAAGIESARRAGMQVVALDTTYPARALAAADALAGTLADVQIEVREDEMTVSVAEKQGRNE
ncbi:MAG TPA: HAD-IA family hydrolase [Candidatus Angelobacter sp.]|nr:HAD-IA family hydrolase [Candidatus Angelobacter sp.]